MSIRRRMFSVAAISLCIAPVLAAAPEGIAFSHQDWELVCDNTRTCRVVGYPSDEEPGTVSVLFTRKAGPGAAVAGRVLVGGGWDEDDFELPARFKLELRIDGRAHGSVAMTNEDRAADLAPAQVSALLGALTRSSRIEFRAQKNVWRLSDRGASAVLLKMDEAQGRVGTVGALRRKGKNSEANVLPPVPAPVVRAVAPHPPLPNDERSFEKQQNAIRAALRKATSSDECMDLHESESQESLEIVRLTKTKLLVSTRCWLAAYNAGSGYWVIDGKAPYNPQFVTGDGTDYDDGVIGASHKGRGLGDCWGKGEWTWDGTRFVQTLSSSTGQCKGFLGGAWDLPTLVADVRKGN
jgi:hypothetical protein